MTIRVLHRNPNPVKGQVTQLTKFTDGKVVPSGLRIRFHVPALVEYMRAK